LVIRTFRLCARVGIGIAAVAAVLATAVALRLMAGPIDLDFLKPHFLNEFDTPGGKVRVDSIVGRGTTVTCEFPVDQAHRNAAE